MTIYTFTVFDQDPNASGGGAWPHMENKEIEAEDPTEAAEGVERIMSAEAAGLSPEDYSAGDVLYANIWHEDGTCVASPRYTITEEDLQ